MIGLARRTQFAVVALVTFFAKTPSYAHTIDFESPAYLAEKTIAGLDQWMQPDVMGASDNFKIQAGVGGKWVHASTSTTTTIYRNFPSNNNILDVRWKWRSLSDSAHFCLGVSGTGVSARLSNRALACLEPFGTLSVQGAGLIKSPVSQTWTQGVWHYMRMVLDNTQSTNKFALYISEDSLRGVERVALPATPMGGSGAFTRMVLRDESGSGFVDVDDLSWEAVAIWEGSPDNSDSNWTNAANWSTGVVPDSTTHVIFPASSAGCTIDKNVAVKSITVPSAFSGVLDLGPQVLTVWGKANFTGGRYASSGVGHIHFPSARGHSLTPPEQGKILASIRHEGTGVLRLDSRALFAANLTQLQGTFDFNGYDLVVLGNLTIKNGHPETLRNLDGRSLSVGRKVHLEGTSPETLLGLSATPKGWSLAATNTASDSLTARFAVLGNSRATLSPGYAFQSVDVGSNTGWNFVTLPAGPVSPLPPDTNFNQTGENTIPPPQANPGGISFLDSITIRLRPPAEAPNAVIYYQVGNQLFTKYQDSLVFRESTTLKALAVSGTSFSDTAMWQYNRRLEAPFATPKGRNFNDSLAITLDSKVPVGTVIYYTLDGSEPTPTSAKYTGVPIVIEYSVSLKAISVRGADTSGILSESYNLIPYIPVASHSGGDYSALITLSLTTTSERALIYYTLDGSAPGPDRGLPPYSKPFTLDTSATLKAVAVAGQGAQVQRSGLLIESYTFISPGKRILGPSQRLEFSGNYNLESSQPGASPVDVEVLASDSLKLLKGFRDILFGIRLTLPPNATAFPQLVFHAPTNEPRSLFLKNPNGSAQFVSRNPNAEISVPGTYFLAVDLLAPTITFTNESFTPEDSTRLVVTIQDNVSNLLLDLERSDKNDAGFMGREISATLVLSTSLKNPIAANASLSPLTIRFKVSDHSRQVTFPADGSTYAVAQRFTNPIRTPPTLKIGTSEKEPWDLISVPLAMVPPLTLEQLRKNNSTPKLEGAILDTASGNYRLLTPTESLLPGVSFWLAAPVSLPSLVFPKLQTASRAGAGTYPLKLKPGWNQIANPTMSPLYWPVTRAIPETYDFSPLKGLHAWDAGKLEYVHSETLEPWKGYLAYYKGRRDTVITLRSSPVTPPAPAKTAKVSAESGHGFSFRLNLAGSVSLRLGAFSKAGDAVGLEDETQPPARSARSPRLFSSRQTSKLETDLVHYQRGSLSSWTVIAGFPSRNRNDTAPAPTAQVEGLSLPEGYSAWAVSPKRGMRFLLKSGQGIPVHPGLTDSLEVYVGPAAVVEARLGHISKSVDAFTVRISPSPGRFTLNFALPAASNLRMRLWSLQGKTLESEVWSLPPGHYQIMQDQKGRGYPKGIYLLSLDWTGSGPPGRITRKIAIP